MPSDLAAQIANLDAGQLAELRSELGERYTSTIEAADAALTAAGSGMVGKLASRQGRPVSPERSAERNALVAGAGAAGIAPGTPFASSGDLARTMADTLAGLDKNGPPRGKLIVASARWSLPPERQLGEDAMENAGKMEAVTGPRAPRFDPDTGALVATGGICQPVNVDYAVPTWATANRPIRDGLPAFEATRGGIRYVTPPDIAEWEGATGVWTEVTDATPAGETKPVKVLACGTEQSVYVEAVSTRIGFGNMQSRFAPEQVAANTDLAIAAASRVAENNLLKRIEETAQKNILAEQKLGAARDLLTAMQIAVAAYRNIHRLPGTQPITAILPTWLKDLIRVDIMREQAHGNDSTFNSLMVTDEQIEALVKNVGLTPIWHLDGQPANGSVYKAQTFSTPAEGAELVSAANYATSSMKGKVKEACVWYMFAEGAIQFLDAGRLDLGVVRDSTLDSTNDYETFVETFEGIANRGFSKSAWQIMSALYPNGGSSATVTATGP